MVMSGRAATVIAALTLLVVANADSADSNGMFATKSVGTLDCQRYLDVSDYGERDFILFAGYLGGYITAYNQLTPETFDILPWQSIETLLVLLKNYCRQNSDHSIYLATAQMIQLLKPDKIEELSPLVEVRVDDQTLTIYQDTLRRVQDKLIELGYYDGASDGAFGPDTQGALEKYQADRELPPTGLPDQVTLFSLLSGLPPEE